VNILFIIKHDEFLNSIYEVLRKNLRRFLFLLMIIWSIDHNS